MKLNQRMKGHQQLLAELKAYPILGSLVCGVIPQNEAVSYSHHHHMSVFHYDPQAVASQAYAQLFSDLVRQLASTSEGEVVDGSQIHKI